MPNLKRLEEAREWLRHAGEDLEAAEILVAADRPRPRQALFHAQQAVEKSLKAFLVAHGVSYPLTHNLTLLMDLCAEIETSLLELVRPVV